VTLDLLESEGVWGREKRGSRNAERTKSLRPIPGSQALAEKHKKGPEGLETVYWDARSGFQEMGREESYTCVQQFCYRPEGPDYEKGNVKPRCMNETEESGAIHVIRGGKGPWRVIRHERGFARRRPKKSIRAPSFIRLEIMGGGKRRC